MSHSRSSSGSDSDSSSAAPLNLQEDREWQDVEQDAEQLSFRSLFSDQTFDSLDAWIQESKRDHGLDLAAVVKQFDLDFYGAIKLVNYIRSEVKSGNTKPDVSKESLFQDDRYLQPVLEDDAVLFSLDDVIDSWKGEAGDSQPQSRVAELEEQLARLQAQFQDYRADVAKLLDSRWAAGPASGEASADAGPADADADRRKSRPVRGKSSTDVRKPFQDNDTYYFDSYAYNDIHETMLKDAVRTDAYRDFTYAHKPLFGGKTVLDVGCGTGILSMFAAKAGATRVLAVDNSSVAEKAKQNVAANGLDQVVTVHRGKIEDLHLPLDAGDRVDVLVSEWMGYGLLYEAMLPSVLFARTAYLNPTTGIMAPSHMTMRIAPVADAEYVADTVSWWSDVYGFDMRAMTAAMHDDVVVRSPKPEHLAAPGCTFRELDLYTVGNADLDFRGAPFRLVLDRDIDALDAFVIWFDTFFLPERSAQLPRADGQPVAAEDFSRQHRPEEGRGVAFTTGPGGPRTHWEAAMLLVDRTQGHGARAAGSLALAKGAVISGSVGYARRESNDRQLDIVVEWSVEGLEERGRQTWSLK